MPTDHYLLSDLLYRSRALTSSAGAIQEAYDTDAYGNTLIFDAPGAGGDWWADDASLALESVNTFIFTGRRFDTESAIYFYRARYYEAATGRFLGRDPLIYVDGMSLYAAFFAMQGQLDPMGCDSAFWEFIRCYDECLQDNDPLTAVARYILGLFAAGKVTSKALDWLPDIPVAKEKLVYPA